MTILLDSSDSANNVSDSGSIGIITSQHAMGKSFTYNTAEGKLEKTDVNIERAGDMSYERVHFRTPEELALILGVLSPNKMIMCGHALNERTTMVVSQRRHWDLPEAKKATTIARTKEHIVFAGRGVALLDLDYVSGLDTPEDVLERIHEFLPECRSTGIVIQAGSSSFLTAPDGSVLKGASSWHVFIFFEGDDTEFRSLKELVLTRMAIGPNPTTRIELSRPNKTTGICSKLERGLFDPSVFDPTRVVFINPTVNGCTRNAPEVFFTGEGFCKISDLAHPTAEDKLKRAKLIAKLKAALSPQVLSQTVEHVEKLHPSATKTAVLKIARKSIRQWESNTLSADFIVNVVDYGEMTVRAAVALARTKPEQSLLLVDLYPSSSGTYKTNRTKLFVGTHGPYITTFAHGGCTYTIPSLTNNRAVKFAESEANQKASKEINYKFDETFAFAGRFDRAELAEKMPAVTLNKTLIICNAGMGAGKTSQLAAHIQAEFAGSFEFVSPRISINSSTSELLGLTNANEGYTEIVCINSIHRLSKGTKALFIDEASACLSSATIGSTMRDHRLSRLDSLREKLADVWLNAGCVVLAEDGFDAEAIRFYTDFAKTNGAKVKLVSSAYVHERKSEEVIFSDAHSHYVSVLKAVYDGDRTFGIASSKGKANKMAADIMKTMQRLPLDVSSKSDLDADRFYTLLTAGVLLITADTPAEIREPFMANPVQYLRDNNIKHLIATYTIETGFSIDALDLFDSRWFSFSSLSASSALQAFERVRCDIPALVYLGTQNKQPDRSTAAEIKALKHAALDVNDEGQTEAVLEFEKSAFAFRESEENHTKFRREFFIQQHTERLYNLSFNEDKTPRNVSAKLTRDTKAFNNKILEERLELIAAVDACDEDEIEAFLKSKDAKKNLQAEKAIKIKVVGRDRANDADFMLGIFGDHGFVASRIHNAAFLIDNLASDKYRDFLVDRVRAAESRLDIKTVSAKVRFVVELLAKDEALMDMFMGIIYDGQILATDDRVSMLHNAFGEHDEAMAEVGLAFSKSPTSFFAKLIGMFGFASEDFQEGCGKNLSHRVNGTQARNKTILNAVEVIEVAELKLEKMLLTLKNHQDLQDALVQTVEVQIQETKAAELVYVQPTFC